jgi:5-formyltetrahydrofolate cyclo-ligase
MSTKPACGKLTKKRIRSKILARLKIQKEEDRDRKSQLIKHKLFRTSVFKKAKTVMFYISFDGEVDTQGMIKEAHRLGKRVAVPVCKKHKISIMPCILKNKAGLRKGPYGVCEPAVKKYMKLEELDLVIVPGVAFDKKGNRLGRGGGCYDHFLQKIPCDTPSIGLAYSFQILPFLPTTKTDVKIGRVISA